MTIDPQFKKLIKSELLWLPEKGMGYYPVKATPYDKNYFNKYVAMARTKMGEEITKQRIQFVNDCFSGKLVDIGIGCGQFIETRISTTGKETVGFDINPVGVQWLKSRGILFNPYKNKIDAATFFDSLEHIHNPHLILKNIKKWAFVSVPIFKDANHLLRSKHFKKQEHCWYWTQEGITRWFKNYGFTYQKISNFESILGREDIWSFAFKRGK